MNYQCLMIDDDITIAENTTEYFNLFDIKTAYVTGYEEALAFLSENTVSLLLLDINLGEKSGYDLCREIRRQFDMPILFISARTSDNDILAALHIGGDDYITKPFSLNILLAKATAIIKRYESAAEAVKAASAALPESPEMPFLQRIPVSAEIYHDTAQHKLIRGGESVPLKAMEYKMLLYLLEHRGRVVTKDEFLQNVWQDTFVGEGTLAVHIRHLREKIEQDVNAPAVIKTIWGVGYLMEDTGESN